MSMIDESESKLKYPTREMWAVIRHDWMGEPAITEGGAWINGCNRSTLDDIRERELMGYKCVRVIVSVKQE